MSNYPLSLSPCADSAASNGVTSSSMSSGAIWPATTAARFLFRRLWRFALRHFCPVDTGGITRVPRPGVGAPFTSESDSRGGLRRRVDIPAIAPLFVDIGRVQAGTRSRRGRPVAVATVWGHFLVPGHFTPAWHIGAAVQSRIRVTVPRKITGPGASRQRDKMHLRFDRHRWEISSFSCFTCRHASMPRLHVKFRA